MVINKSPKLFISITSPISIVLLKGQLSYMKSKGYEVSLIAPADKRVKEFVKLEGINHITVNFAREISPWKDLITIYRLIKVLLSLKPDLVNAGTPKAALLTLIAAYIAGIKHKIYTCRGLRYESENGLKKWLLKFIEKTNSWVSDKTICVGPGLREKALQDKLFNPEKCIVIGRGSSNGINLSYFTRNASIDNAGLKIRHHLEKGSNKIVIGFVGRLIERKGINELVLAYDSLYKRIPNLMLLLVGGMDEGQRATANVQNLIEKHPGIVCVDWVDDVRPYLASFDLFVLPSYWEGFGNVLLQAAAFELPIVTTNGTGCYDAVHSGFNATVIQIKSTDELIEAIAELILDKDLREKYSKNSREWVKNFDSEKIWAGMDELYKEMLTGN